MSPLLWTQSQLSPLDDTIVCVTQSGGAGGVGQLLYMDISVNASTPFDCMIERVGFALEGLAKTTTITSIYPHIQGPGSLYVRLGSQDYPGAATRWKPPVLFNPNTDRKVDMRTTGELHCFQFYTEDTAEGWSISGMDIEYADAGAR